MAGTSGLQAPLTAPLTEFTDDELDNAQAWIGPYKQDLEEYIEKAYFNSYFRKYHGSNVSV